MCLQKLFKNWNTIASSENWTNSPFFCELRAFFFILQENPPKSEGPPIHVQPSTPTSPKPRKYRLIQHEVWYLLCRDGRHATYTKHVARVSLSSHNGPKLRYRQLHQEIPALAGYNFLTRLLTFLYHFSAAQINLDLTLRLRYVVCVLLNSTDVPVKPKQKWNEMKGNKIAYNKVKNKLKILSLFPGFITFCSCW